MDINPETHPEITPPFEAAAHDAAPVTAPETSTLRTRDGTVLPLYVWRTSATPRSSVWLTCADSAPRAPGVLATPPGEVLPGVFCSTDTTSDCKV